MKMQFSFVLAAIFAVVVFIAACKKSNPGPGPVNTYLVKTWSRNVNGSTNLQTFTYDSLGRLINQQFSNTSHMQVAYGNDTIYQFYFDSGQTVPTGILVLSENSNAYVLHDNQGDVYNYDASGEETSQHGPLGNKSFAWANGNVINAWDTVNGIITSTTNTYLTSAATISFGEPYFGKTSNNLINRNTVDSAGIGTVYACSYQFDGQGRLSQQTITATGYTEVDSFTY